MDVRCDKCGTEYELDDTRLKPGGVTVKCTSCGHLFKVRGRSVTVMGVGSPAHNVAPGAPQGVAGGPAGGPPQHATRAKTQSGTRSGTQPGAADAVPRTAPMPDSSPIPRGHDSTGSGAIRERKWMILLPSGEIEICRELATLQQWIVSGKVTRNSGISRTGQSWKQLGEIAELRSFFTIADQALEARRERSRPLSAPEPAYDPAPDPAPEPAQDPAPEPAPEPMRAATAPAGAAESGRWGGKATHVESSGPVGPTGGLARGVATADVAFARSKSAPLSHELGAEPGPGGLAHGRDEGRDDERDDEYTAERSRAGRWIVVISLLLMAGAATVVYLLVFRQPSTTLSSTLADAPVADAAAPDAAPADAHDEAPDEAIGKAEILAAAQARILALDISALEAAETDLAGVEGADADIDVLVTRARIHMTLAQHVMDQSEGEAAAGYKQKAAELKRQAQERVLDALTLVTRALKLDREHPDASAVMADVSRLQGKRARDVEDYLKKALARDRKHREALLVQALLHAREKMDRKARDLLTELSSGQGAMETSGDVRPVYRLAFMDFAAGILDDASRRAEAVLALQPEHEAARALLTRIADARIVDTSDPLPPEEVSGSEPRGSGTRGGEPRGSGSRDSDSYDALVAKADRKAQNGNCREAMELYERAVDMNPIGMAALTGMGYCHIERREFASAHAKFKAALVASPRYPDALWGIAEMYQQQGLKGRAVEAYQRFIEEHPQSSRAASARQQIERLGGARPDPGGDPSGTGSSGRPDDAPDRPGKPPEDQPGSSGEAGGGDTDP